VAKKKKKESTQDKLVNLQAATLAAQVANWAAQLEFSKERFRLLEMPQFQQMTQLELDKFAWQKAQQTWERAFQESSLTGTYNGQPTVQWLTEQARLTGVLNGQETLEGKLTNAQIKQMEMEMNLRNQQHLLEIGKFDWAKELEGKQLVLQQELQEASLTGMHKGAKTFEREQFEAEQGQQYLQLLSSLQGPANAFKQLRAIQGGDRTGMSRYGSQWLENFGQGPVPEGDPRVSVPPGGVPGGGGPGDNRPPGGPLMPGQGGVPGAPGAPAAPPPVGPPAIGGPIPGRGFDPSTWNDATRAAVAEWEAQHPGYKLDGSQTGYVVTDPAAAAATAQPMSASGIQSQDFAGVAGPTTPEQAAAMATGQVPAMPAYQPGAVYDPVSGLMQQPDTGLSPQDLAAAERANVTPEQYAVLKDMYSANLQPTAPITYKQETPGVQPPRGIGLPQGPYTDPSKIGVQQPGIGLPTGPYTDPSKGETLPHIQPPIAAGEKTAAMPGYTYSPDGYKAPTDAYNYAFAKDGQTQVYPPGVQAPDNMPEISANTPMTQESAKTAYTQLDPRQINARAYANANPYQQKMTWAAFEDMGWDAEAAQSEFQASLPKYGGPAKGRMVGGF
jgi:hypothetical protein